MKRRNKGQQEEQAAAEADDVQTIFGDLVTFIMMLFVLLFVLSYNENKEADFFTELQVKFGEKLEKKQQSMTTDQVLVSQIEHYIKKQDLEEHSQILVDERRVKLIINPPLLFDSGRAVLKPRGVELVEGFGKVFQTVKNPLIIEGHTDNVPIHNDEFDSNWDLSFHRAYAVVKHLVVKMKFIPTRLSGLGFGEYRPLVANDTKENRAKNRRIEVNIIRVTKNELQDELY